MGGTTVAVAGAADDSASPGATTTERPADGAGRGPGGPVGPGRGPGGRENLAAVAKALGVTTAQLRTALDSTRPTDRASDRPARGAPGGRGAELTSGLSKSEAEVRAALDTLATAHRAEHAARETALYAAVAKALGKEAADVKAAFEAARPSRG
ncbi:MAG TPA: hypothetical protein VLK58_08330 [Conexibacter sp.]|nr:hypothetical protein [Conexibacter sp.]